MRRVPPLNLSAKLGLFVFTISVCPLLVVGLLSYNVARQVSEGQATQYTQALLAAVPVPDPRKRRKERMPEGEIPNPIHPPSGCRFHPRCPLAQEICSKEVPEMRELRPGHTVACHYAEKFL